MIEVMNSFGPLTIKHLIVNESDLKIKKKENDNLQDIFYKGSTKKGSY